MPGSSDLLAVPRSGNRSHSVERFAREWDAAHPRQSQRSLSDSHRAPRYELTARYRNGFIGIIRVYRLRTAVACTRQPPDHGTDSERHGFGRNSCECAEDWFTTPLIPERPWVFSKHCSSTMASDYVRYIRAAMGTTSCGLFRLTGQHSNRMSARGLKTCSSTLRSLRGLCHSRAQYRATKFPDLLVSIHSRQRSRQIDDRANPRRRTDLMTAYPNTQSGSAKRAPARMFASPRLPSWHAYSNTGSSERCIGIAAVKRRVKIAGSSTVYS